MSASTLLFFLVISGAVLFFAAGYLFRILQHLEKGPAKRQLLGDIDALNQQLEATLASEQQLQAHLDDAREAAEKRAVDISRLAAENNRLLEAVAESEAVTLRETAPNYDAVTRVISTLPEIDTDNTPSSIELDVSAAEGADEQESAAAQKDQEHITSLEQEIEDLKKQLNRANISLAITKEETRKLNKEISALKTQESTSTKEKKKYDEMAKKLAAAEEKVAGVSKLERENRYLRREVQHLATQTVKAKKTVKPTTLKLRQAFETTMKEIVSDLLEMDQVQTVVVADVDGQLVGGIGEAKTFDGLAELCGRIGSIGQETEFPHPLSEIRTAHLKDTEDGIIACRTFRKNKKTFVLGTVGRNSPPGEGVMELTVSDLSDDH